MPEYQYIAQTGNGAIIRGRVVGVDPTDVKEQLSRRGRRLIGIQLVKNVFAAWQTPQLSFRFFRRFRSIHPSDRELLLRQLAVMVGSGLELTSSLHELGRVGAKPRLKKLCSDLADGVEQGQSFANAVEESQSFPPLVRRLIQVGEQTGELSIALERAADFTESRRQTTSTFLSALAYPALVAIAACSVAAYLVGYAIPKLAVFLHAMGRKLPAMTQSLIDIAELLQRFGPQCVVLTLAAMTAMVLVYLWPHGRYRIDQALLRLPLIGSLVRMVETQQLASSLALMLRSGVFLPEAIETAATLHRNRYLETQVRQTRDQVAIGKDLGDAFRGKGFEPMLPSMIAVGESTGDLPSSLEHVATFYRDQVGRKLKRFGRLLEPTIIVVVGGLVGYVYTAFFMALLSAGGNFK